MDLRVMLWSVFGGMFLVMLGILALMVAALVVKMAVRGSGVNQRGAGWRVLGNLLAGPKGGMSRAGGFGVEVRRATMLTATEARFFQVLRLALPPGTYLLAKVRLRDLFVFDGRCQEGFVLNNKCSQKHADFVVVSEVDHLPLVVIELDDWTHGRAKARERDGVKDELCARAGLAVRRVQAGGDYNEAALNGMIREAMAGYGPGMRVG